MYICVYKYREEKIYFKYLTLINSRCSERVRFNKCISNTRDILPRTCASYLRRTRSETESILAPPPMIYTQEAGVVDAEGCSNGKITDAASSMGKRLAATRLPCYFVAE